MAAAIHCTIGVNENGVPYWDFWTTPDGERRGLMHASSTVSLRNLVDDGVPPDYHVGVAIATAALGSRLLRLASEIHSIRPLFVVRDVLGGTDR
jgi:hypothetical protein